MSDPFSFLQAEWPLVHEAASQAVAAAHPDPRAACFYARRALELAVNWAFEFDDELHPPYQDNLSALVYAPSFKRAAGGAVVAKARIVITLGNRAVHARRAVPHSDAVTALRELFHIGFWFARTYARKGRPTPGVAFDPNALPQAAPLPKQTLDQLQKLEASLRERDEKLSAALADKSDLDEQLKQLRAEVAAAKAASLAQPDTHDYSEAQTRDAFIDVLLREAGWALDRPRDREFEVSGMPNVEKKGFVDYVLWGDDGKPLALVEAKRTKVSPHQGQQQAKLYADCLEAAYGQRPVIFYTNGYEHWLWDDTRYAPREVQGFFKKAELELMLWRRTNRRTLTDATVNSAIVERYYQTRAIRRIGEAFERDHERKALLVMATGAGKTRTVIALADLLMRCNWAKRVLFLADRTALVSQAVRAFRKHLPDCSPVNLVTERDTDGRVMVSTYPTMVGLIDESSDGQRRFGPGHFDLIVIDEAHRSVYQKYRAIFEYFDSLLVGLTATPKDDIDKNTYSLFDLESGVPTDVYGLDDAVADAFLVPARAVSVPLKFHREGIAYDDLTDEEKAQWDETEWDEDGSQPSRVEAAAVNQWLFNKDTVDKVLEHLMTRGQKVAGGDRLGKTIVFAKNQDHAEFIAQRFDANYPQYRGAFARVIHSGLPYAQSLIDDFEIPEKAPHIAVSVDMLDTGIDVPSVVNLVFIKLVRSKTKFWQMVGRGTRLCPDLFAPGRNKEFFYIFDYCENLEFFKQNLPATEGASSDSLGRRLFKSRLELINVLDGSNVTATPAGVLRTAEPPRPAYESASKPDQKLRTEVATLLRAEVAAMNLDNFVVRPKRRLVEKYAKEEAWTVLDATAVSELGHEVAGLPSEQESEDQEAKRFDLLMLRLTLALLRTEPTFKGLREQVQATAGLMGERAAIPMVREHREFILSIQTDEWWQDVTPRMIDNARKALRALVKLIDKQKRKPIYTDFEDHMGPESPVDLPVFTLPEGFERFRAKARVFLRQHQDHVTIHKLRMNKALTKSDLDELERMLTASGVGGAEDVHQAAEESHGLGLFVRSLIGLDREAAKEALAEFLRGKVLTANQIEFTNLIVNHLTQHGSMKAELLYETPFTDVAPTGPDGIFTAAQVEELLAVLVRVEAAALAL